VNVAATGNAIYYALKDSPQSIAAIRTEFASLALSLATDPASIQQVTSATVNGQSFSAQPTMTQGQRFAMLRWVLACVDNCSPISTTQISRF